MQCGGRQGSVQRPSSSLGLYIDTGYELRIGYASSLSIYFVLFLIFRSSGCSIGRSIRSSSMQDTATPPHECTPTPEQLVAWSVEGLVKMHPTQLPRRKRAVFPWLDDGSCVIKIIISPGVRGIILIGSRKKALGESGSRISRSWRLNVHLMSTSDKYRGNSHRNLACLWRAATPTRKHARSCPL